MRRHGSAAPAALGFTPAALGFTLAALGFTFAGSGAAAQISRHPTGVNVNAMGATTVFITFGNLAGKIPVEAIWCGALVPASPEIGDRCDPSTIYGSLPLRYDLSRPFRGVRTRPPHAARRPSSSTCAASSIPKADPTSTSPSPVA
jgi:hypothetical protein